MKITRTDPVYVQPQSQRKAGATPAPQPQASQGEARISATAQTINQARVELASTSDVEKVNQIRQAISEGRLELDMDALSQAILDMHRR